MLFKDIIGQDQVKQKLLDMVKQNRLSHALLFLGKEGSGSLPLALAFSEYISLLPLNESKEVSLFDSEQVDVYYPSTPDEADEWMQKQPAFNKAEKLIHPDIHFTFPVITKKPGTPPISSDYITEWREFIFNYPYGNIYDWLQFIEAENKQGNITALECNDIIRKLNLKSFESTYKTLVLWMPEYLGKEGNKLLKLIEEPPPDTVFILVAENEKNILSTILSRCQLIKIPQIDELNLAYSLEKRNKLDAVKANQIASLSNGNYREALNILQHADEDYYNLLRDWLNATLKNQIIIQLKSIDELSRLGRENQKQFLNYFNNMLELAIRFRLSANNSMEANLNRSTSENDFVGKLNKAISIEQMEAISEELNHAIYHIERNANARILFHALTIKIFYIVKNNVVLIA